MSARFEQAEKINAKTKQRIKGYSKDVKDFYNNISTSKEPRTCYYYIDAILKMTDFFTNQPNTFDYNTIKEPQIAKYMNTIAYKFVDGEKRETSFSHRKTVWSALNVFFTYLHRRKIIDENPMDYIERANKKDDVKRPYLQANDLKKILKAIEEGGDSDNEDLRKWLIPRNKAIFLLFITTGMRRGALSQIDVDDIDFGKKQLQIIDKGNVHFTYDLDDTVIEAIEEWLIRRKERLRSSKLTNALFINGLGDRLNSANIRIMINTYSQKALGYKISPHKLRAAYCTLYYEATHDIFKVQQAVKHASVLTTQKYIVSNQNYQQEASNTILKMMR